MGLRGVSKQDEGTKQGGVKWIRAKHYALLSGESVAAVHGKRKAGHYIDGIHTKVAEDGNLWVNVEAIERWVEQGRKSSLGA